MRFKPFRTLCSLALAGLSTGCVYVISADEDTLDRFAEFQVHGGECTAAVPSDDVGAFAAISVYRWLAYEDVLEAVRGPTGVRYPKLSTDVEIRDMLRQTVRQVSQINPEKLEDYKHKLAFWLNAYNAIVLEAAATGFADDPAFRVDLNDFAFFARKTHGVGGRSYSLNEIENGVIRGDRYHPSTAILSDEEWAPLQEAHETLWEGQAFDPRIHFALNCASSSCPHLDAEPWRGDDLDDRLEAATRTFLLDEARGAGPGGISQIFDFYAVDFEAVGGIDGFISQYRSLDNVDTGRFLQYDWSLNLDETP